MFLVEGTVWAKTLELSKQPMLVRAKPPWGGGGGGAAHQQLPSLLLQAFSSGVDTRYTTNEQIPLRTKQTRKPPDHDTQTKAHVRSLFSQEYGPSAQGHCGCLGVPAQSLEVLPDLPQWSS